MISQKTLKMERICVRIFGGNKENGHEVAIPAKWVRNPRRESGLWHPASHISGVRGKKKNIGVAEWTWDQGVYKEWIQDREIILNS